MSMKVWTRGQKRSLVRVTAPRKDAGNGTLMIDDSMWTYSPKVNRVMKVPSSMMGQSWLGSDFSNKDVSRADTIVDQYDHTLLEKEESEGHTVSVIESIPHEDAAVVWGKEVLKIRDDNVLVSEDFYDQDGKLVKSLRSLDIGEMGGRMLALRQRMEKLEAEDEWTEISLDSMRFDLDLPDSLFTRSNLRNPRD
jgi:outer membrane lipoprotein-sorting protein